MNLQPSLENELVVVRPLTTQDYDALFLAASDPAIWEQHTTNDRWKPDGFRKFFEESLGSKGALVIIDKRTNEIVGSSRYHQEEDTPEAIEIGWSFLTKACWGGQFNRSFKTLMIEHALTEKADVLFLIAKDNLRSQKATEKLGGERLNKKDYPQYFRKAETHYTYRINADIWNKSA